jgi:hypothetical protein
MNQYTPDRLNQRGHLNGLLIPLILSVLLFVGAASFGLWAYSSRQDYKNNADKKIEAAVVVAEENNSTKKDNEFAEKEKLPLRTYSGPAAFGSLVLQYPKTWSAYVSERANNATPIDAYFHPGFVPAPDGNNTTYALRTQVVNTSYSEALKAYDSNVKTGKIKATPYNPAKNPSVTGTRLDGEITTGKQGAMIIVPLRDKTLKIWTESNDYINDFNTNILPNYSFAQ